MTPQDRVQSAIAELADALRAEMRAELDARRADPPTLLDVQEAARLLGVSRTTIYTLLDKQDGLPTLRIGKRVLIAREAVDRFAARTTR